MAVSDGFVVVYFIGESLYNMPIFRHLHIFGHMHQYILVTFSVHISPNKKGAPAVWRKPDRFAFKANVPFSNGTFPFQMERSLFKWNVPFSNGTLASQRERSLFNWNVRFPKGPFASQRDRSLPKGNVRFSKGTFAFQRERSMLL